MSREESFFRRSLRCFRKTSLRTQELIVGAAVLLLAVLLTLVLSSARAASAKAALDGREAITAYFAAWSDGENEETGEWAPPLIHGTGAQSVELLDISGPINKQLWPVEIKEAGYGADTLVYSVHYRVTREAGHDTARPLEESVSRLFVLRKDKQRLWRIVTILEF